MTHEQSPTAETYGDFQLAYMTLNMSLFDGALPDVMFTLARTRHANGYVMPEGFNAMHDGETVAEIGLNPQTFAERTAEQILSTIAHEMVHLDQHLNGKPSPYGYHNKEFARRMLAIGLQTSDTGQPGGNDVGQHMTHYILDGGPFQVTARKLIADGWAIRYTSPVESDMDKTRRVARKASKTRYSCPCCKANAWGRPGLLIACGTGHPVDAMHEAD
jgi:predicted SprT family Zn-dependent metalloprotease